MPTTFVVTGGTEARSVCERGAHQVKADTEKHGPFGLPGGAMLPIPHLPGDSLDTDDFVSARVDPWDRSSV